MCIIELLKYFQELHITFIYIPLAKTSPTAMHNLEWIFVEGEKNQKSLGIIVVFIRVYFFFFFDQQVLCSFSFPLVELTHDHLKKENPKIYSSHGMKLKIQISE